MDDGSTNLPSVAMHELFHLVQYGIWSHMDPSVLEASAEWAGFRFIGFPLAVDFGGTSPVPLLDTVGLPDMSLTCNGESCGATDYEALGYSRWHFFEFLSERFGSGTVNDLFQRGKTVNDPAVGAGDLLMQMLTAKGSTLGDVFHDWTVANMTGTYTAIGLKGIKPPAYSTTLTGSGSGTLATQKIPVNHLAARYVAFKRGTGTSDGPCYAATLNISVTRALRHRRAADVQVDGSRQPGDPARAERLDGEPERALGHLLVERRRPRLASQPVRQRRRRAVQRERVDHGRQEDAGDLDAARLRAPTRARPSPP